MAGDVERDQWNRADVQLVAVVEQAIELRAIAGELGAFVENLPEYALDGDDLAADGEFPAQFLLEVGAGR